MAKKKKSHRRKHHRIGGMKLSASNPLIKWGSVVVGFLAGKPINTAVDGLMPASFKTNTNYAKITAAGEGGLGALLVFKFGKRSLITTVAGGILLGAGLKRAMEAFNINLGALGGYGEVPVLAGYGRVPVIGKRVSGYSPNGSLGGYTPGGTLNGNKPPHLQVMGNIDSSCGSGLLRSAGCMDN